MTVAQAIEALQRFNPDHLLIGNCVDQQGTWYTYPVEFGKVPGNNTMVVVQLAPAEYFATGRLPEPPEQTETSL